MRPAGDRGDGGGTGAESRCAAEAGSSEVQPRALKLELGDFAGGAYPSDYCISEPLTVCWTREDVAQVVLVIGLVSVR